MKTNKFKLLAICLMFGTFSVLTTNATNALSTSAAMVDLTSAAESTVNSVVYIKVTIAGKIVKQSYTSPFDDFFGDFF